MLPQLSQQDKEEITQPNIGFYSLCREPGGFLDFDLDRAEPNVT